MKDFLIKLLGGYKAVIVIIEKSPKKTISISKIVTFYPFVKMIVSTKFGTVSFNKDMSVTFTDSKKKK